MLNRLNIGPRLVLLIAIQTLVLLVIGVTAIAGLNYATNTTQSLNKSVIEQVSLNQINDALRSDLLQMVNEVAAGKLDWQEGRARLAAARNLFINNWDEYKEDKTASEVQDIEASLGNEYNNVLNAFGELQSQFNLQDRAALNTYLDTAIPQLVKPFLTELNERVNEHQLLSESLFDQTVANTRLFLSSSIGIILIGLALSALLGYFIHRSISRPVKNISSAVRAVAEGDYGARTDMDGSDELSELGQAFDALVEDKVTTLARAEAENEMLNNSVISLLQAVSRLSQRDLTIRVPVTEDVTGPVADALNQLTAETSKVLSGVRRVSEEVANASNLVKSQSDNVIVVAEKERAEVEQTARELADAANAMKMISDLAQNCNFAAEEAITTTHTAMNTVNDTVEGINGIRQNIHETEKRIKRLGERSQEISRAVNLINSISERTHILALNASMHAASAGEAGKGFAVVADEVQRLAENARDATSQISTLVSNIQVETADTVATMNNVITQVVEGSKLAEEAGRQMQQTKERTEGLVQSVREIANRSESQSEIANQLQYRTEQIKESTQQTSSQLQKQTVQTKRLVEYSHGLLTAVQVFKLDSGPQDSDAEAGVVPLDNVEELRAS